MLVDKAIGAILVTSRPYWWVVSTLICLPAKSRAVFTPSRSLDDSEFLIRTGLLVLGWLEWRWTMKRWVELVGITCSASHMPSFRRAFFRVFCVDLSGLYINLIRGSSSVRPTKNRPQTTASSFFDCGWGCLRCQVQKWQLKLICYSCPLFFVRQPLLSVGRSFLCSERTIWNPLTMTSGRSCVHERMADDFSCIICQET